MKISLVQMIIESNRIKINMDKIIAWINDAVINKCDIICFPEYALTGMISEDEYNEINEEINIAINEIEEIADKKNICIILGLVNRVDGKLYNSQKVFIPNKAIDSYKKIGLGKKELTMYTQGNQLKIFEYKDIKFGISLCYENHFPNHIRNFAKSGANVVFAPHFMPGMNSEKRVKVWNKYMTARAYDNRIYMLACNGLKSDGELNSGGGVAVWDYNGEILADYLMQNEKLVVVELDLDEQFKYYSKSRNKKYQNFLDDEYLFVDTNNTINKN